MAQYYTQNSNKPSKKQLKTKQNENNRSYKRTEWGY